ncbi:polyhydroxyalkanoate synthase [Sinobacterium caligoides]|uniref:Polyhydroxyalkanoate synthase n=1 Tax=Sinobacterium caligoides TaxID=933926 RepID=A0A3N2E053_9GAMM|nr:class I poly(R)-hydroxyalkanoic acid synthase [Sinobacterium caligoides]ROS05292.1 polyhydroxyalkanoate synthase [Sinobacterium caligoides]
MSQDKGDDFLGADMFGSDFWRQGLSDILEAGSIEKNLGDLAGFVVNQQNTMLKTLTGQVSSAATPYSTLMGSLNEILKGAVSTDSSHPEAIVERQFRLLERQLDLYQSTVLKMCGVADEQVEEKSSAAKADGRFKDLEWRNNILFDFIRQSYLMTSESVLESIQKDLAVDEKSKARLHYVMRQMISAMSPTNFPLTNPEVLRKTVETKGENLIKGMMQMLEDKSFGGEFLNACQTDPEAFSVGQNLACTEGSVVYENRLLQLIHYKPLCKSVTATPLLLVPSWVNKYYIMDLSSDNSLVKWLLEQGVDVYMISWVNPDESFRDVTVEDYIEEGLLSAVDFLSSQGINSVSAAGYCLGGLLLSLSLAVMKKRNDQRIVSASYLATSFDFTDPGDIAIFINEQFVDSIDKMMEQKGYLDGRMLAFGFSLLRENDLYWNYYIQNYLLGERPEAFDIMHWNSDSTHVPYKLHSFVLRDLHLDNRLASEEGVNLCGVSIDLSSLDIPNYIVATEKDHIAHWQSCYSGTAIHGGQSRFVLAGSGHIAGVINPPCKEKYHHRIIEQGFSGFSELPDVKAIEKIKGSWWPDWVQWFKAQHGEMKKPLRENKKTIIESAPGRYVCVSVADHERERSEESSL